MTTPSDPRRPPRRDRPRRCAPRAGRVREGRRGWRSSTRSGDHANRAGNAGRRRTARRRSGRHSGPAPGRGGARRASPERAAPASRWRPVKGQLLRLRDRGRAGFCSGARAADGGLLTSWPRGDGGYVLGATMGGARVRRGRHRRRPCTTLLRDAVRGVVPGNHRAADRGGRCGGCAPGRPTNAPAIGAGGLEGPATGRPGTTAMGVLLAPASRPTS